jgi:hypothetical protein
MWQPGCAVIQGVVDQLDIDGHDNAAGHGKFCWPEKSARDCHPGIGTESGTFVEQPSFAVAEQIGDDHTCGLVLTLDPPKGEACLAHCYERKCFVGAGLDRH